MFLEIAIVVLLGIVAGTFTGLIPGIHINLISTFLLSSVSYFLEIFSLTQIFVFIVSMSITHTFVDFIPSIIFGVPNSDTALSVLPAHKLAIEGKAKLAIYLSSLGSLYGIFVCVFMMPIMFLFLDVVYVSIKNFISYFLIFTLFFLILIERDVKAKLAAFVILIFSGGVGVLILNSFLIKNPLFLLFTGLFGISNLLFSVKNNENKFPKQIKQKIKHSISKRSILSGLGLSGTAATLCSIFPGLGNAQAGVLSTFFMKEKSTQLMILMFSAINTINFGVSIFTFYLIERTRNGSVYVLSQILDKITFNQIVLYLGLLLLVGFLAFFLTIFLGKIVLNEVQKINIKLMNISLIIILYVFGFYFSGVYGLIVLHMCAMLGLFALLLGVSRYHLMGVLIVPVLFNLF